MSWADQFADGEGLLGCFGEDGDVVLIGGALKKLLMLEITSRVVM